MKTTRTVRLTVAIAAAGMAGALAAANPATAATDGWTVVTTPVSPNGNDNLNSVGAASDNDAWAVGNTFIAPDANGNTALPLTMHWNGTAWRSVPVTGAAVNSVLQGVAGTAGDAWAVGRSGVSYNNSVPVLLHWNGTAWSAASQPATAGSLAAAAYLSPTNVWAVGRGGRFGPQLVEHFDGTAWSTVTVPPADPAFPSGDQLLAVSAPAANDVWAVGQSSLGPFAQHWNGTAWSLTMLASSGGNLPSGVAATGPNDVWATVNSQNGGNAYVQHFNGTAWSVSTTRPGTEYPTLAGVAARSGTDVWVAGGFLGNINTPSPTREVRTLHWDGTAWTAGTAPNGGGVQINGATVAAGGQRVWVVGTAAAGFTLTRTT